VDDLAGVDPEEIDVIRGLEFFRGERGGRCSALRPHLQRPMPRDLAREGTSRLSDKYG
jgi:hypothetical protein